MLGRPNRSRDERRTSDMAKHKDPYLMYLDEVIENQEEDFKHSTETDAKYFKLIDKNNRERNNLLTDISRREQANDRLYHKENLNLFSKMKDDVKYIRDRGNKGLVDAIKEQFYRFKRAPFWTTFTVLSKAAWNITSGVLFGFGKKQDSVKSAIKEQTEFMRTGQIRAQNNMFTRLFRRGIVGNLAAGAASITGMGRRAAQRGEDRAAEGGRASFRENLARKLFGRDIVRRNIAQGGNKEKESLRIAKKDSKHLEAIMANTFSITGAMNSKFKTPHQLALEENYRKLIEATEGTNLLLEDMNSRQEKDGRPKGGALSAISALFSAQGVKRIGGMILSTFTNALRWAGPALMKMLPRLLVFAPLAKVGAVALITTGIYRFVIRPIIGAFDNLFGTSIGESIDNAFSWLGDKIFGGIRSTFRWIGDRMSDIGSWLTTQLARVPIIGRFFGSTEPDPIEEPSRFQAFRKAYSDAAKDMYSGVLTSFGNATNSFTESYREMGSNLARSTLNLGNRMMEAVTTFDGDYRRAASSMINSIRDTGSNMVSGVRNFFSRGNDEQDEPNEPTVSSVLNLVGDNEEVQRQREIYLELSRELRRSNNRMIQELEAIRMSSQTTASGILAGEPVHRMEDATLNFDFMGVN